MRAFAKVRSDGLERGEARGRLVVTTAVLTIVFFVLAVSSASAAPGATVTLDSVSEVGGDSAHVAGTINPEEIQEYIRGYWVFQYSAEPNPGENPSDDTGWTSGEYHLDFTAAEVEGTNPIVVEDDLEGLAPETEYAVRLTVEFETKNGWSGRFSDPQPHPRFTTPAATTPAATLSPTTIVGTNAHLSGFVTAGNANANCQFEYLTDSSFQSQNEQQSLVVRAEGGAFKLFYEGEETESIPFNADAATVQSALEALSLVGPGDVSVTGGPGDATGSQPYILTFGGTLSNTDVSEVTADPSALTGSGATIEGKTTVQGRSEGFGAAQIIPCIPNPVKKGSAAKVVQADLVGLSGNTTYHLRLKASNLGGESSDTGTFRTDAAPPIIRSSSVADVSEAGATLNASVDPVGADTTYHFEYLTLTQYEEAGSTFTGAVKTGESASLGSDNQDHAALAVISGLEPDTAYRFRIVATNSAGESPGPVTAFHTSALDSGVETCSNAGIRAQQGSTYLPECRAYEIVDKPTLDLGDVNRAPLISDDGNQIAYLSVVPGDEALGAGVVSITVARRTPDGWTRTSADPKSLGYTYNATGFTNPKVFSADFSRVVVNSALPLAPDDTDGVIDAYRIDVGSGTATLMSPNTFQYPVFLGGASPDLSQIVYTENNSDGTNGIYLSGEQRELVSVLPNGDPVPAGLALPVGSRFERGFNVGGFGGTEPSPFVERGGAHGVSDDAHRIYFENYSDHHLYVRDLDASPQRTAAVGVSERASDLGTQAPGVFISASHNGSSAYFASNAQLTDAATAGGGIYRFALDAPEGQRLEQLTPGTAASKFVLIGAIASDDQSHIYFVSSNALSGTPAVSGNQNAYVWSAVGGVRFIANLGEVTGVVQSEHSGALMRVSRDGNYALFQSNSSINGSPNDGHRALFEYDYRAGKLVCVSCRPDGAPSQGDAAIDNQSDGEPGNPVTNSRALTDDGRVFFDSTDRIVSRDQTNAQDVYEYDAGRVSLISSGNVNSNSYLMDNSDDGRHVFFTTRGALVGADRDPAELDVYDAHVLGGFVEPPPPAAPCLGEACRGAGSTAAVGSDSGTIGFVGPANPKSCGKAKVRRNGRCVKGPKPHRSQKKHGAKHKGGKRHVNANGGAGR